MYAGRRNRSPGAAEMKTQTNHVGGGSGCLGFPLRSTAADRLMARPFVPRTHTRRTCPPATAPESGFSVALKRKVSISRRRRVTCTIFSCRAPHNNALFAFCFDFYPRHAHALPSCRSYPVRPPHDAKHQNYNDTRGTTTYTSERGATNEHVRQRFR